MINKVKGTHIQLQTAFEGVWENLKVYARQRGTQTPSSVCISPCKHMHNFLFTSFVIGCFLRTLIALDYPLYKQLSVLKRAVQTCTLQSSTFMS